MRNELEQLKADVPLARFERALALPAMLVRQELQVTPSADVQHSGKGPLLLFGIGHALVDGLQGRAIGPVDLKVGQARKRRLVIRPDLNRSPWPVRLPLAFRHRPTPRRSAS